MNLENSVVPDDYMLDDAPDLEIPQGVDPLAPYGRTETGRIRKRPVGSKKSANGPSPRNAAKAKQAAGVLMEAHAIGVGAVVLMQMYQTAGAMSERAATLEDSMTRALMLDGNLCDTILKGGVQSGKIMLLIAVFTHAIAIAPTAVSEYRERT